jgi:hypothetical protein
MPVLKAFEQIDAGGVDSRSNPINLPRNRALRCQNWVPKQAGFWELRYGYSSVTMSSVTASAIHSMFPYRTWDGHKYVLFMQGTTLKTLDTATGTVTTPTVLGTAIASSAKGAGYFANNRFHYGNGTDQEWFDAVSWRPNGLPALTTAQIQNIAVSEGVRELTPAQASAITLTANAGGSFSADASTGHLIYVAIMSTGGALTSFPNEVGPATIFVGSGRIILTLNQKITLSGLPNLSGVNANWIKLIGGTSDGTNLAFFYTNTLTSINSITSIGGPNQLIEVSATGHGLSANDPITLSGGTNFDGVYSVFTVIDANTFRVSIYDRIGGPPLGAVGVVKRIVNAANAATSVDVLANTQDTVYQVNQNLGIAASTIGGANAGYQFYASIYLNNDGGHVGNRLALGNRLVQTAYRTNVRISGFPDLSLLLGGSPVYLIGRTGDGAVVPYVCTDNAGNWATFRKVVLISTPLFLTQANLDGQHEMPTRNGVIPSQCNMFALAGDFVYAADTASPFLRRSGDLSQATERGNTFTGRPEQSWAPNDIDTFPTGEPTTGMFEVDQEIFMGTLHDSALSVNLAGIQQWVGPWAVGIAGRRAGTKCGALGFYWVTGDKQLCTFNQGVPVVVSDEYELAELSQIGDAFLSTVECAYYRNAAQNKEELRIEAQKTDGTPYTIIHDFKLREVYSAPGSLYGQGYSSQFLGPLATAFTTALVRDGNGRLQVYAGASNGQLYQLYSGADDIGTQYTADLITLVNGGPSRPNVPFVDYYGDANVLITLGRNLSSSIAAGAQWGFSPPNADANVAEAVPGAEQDFLYRVFLVPSEVQRLYIRFQLTSHSADGNLNLNSPIHVPLESYGRIYEVIPAIGDQRDR